jgi:phosphoribosylformylglycinamidine synthase subunit PurS
MELFTPQQWRNVLEISMAHVGSSGSTGHWPVPSGDSPDGMAKANLFVGRACVMSVPNSGSAGRRTARASRPCHQFPKISRFRKKIFAKSFRARMKAKIIITPKKAVVDPQGITVLKALEHMGHRDIKVVHVGKYLEIELDATDKEAARKSLDEAAHKFLSNPVIEDYRLEIE